MARVAVLLALAAVAAAVAAGARPATPPFPECSVSATSSAGVVTSIVSTKDWVSSKYIGSLVTLKRGDSVCTDPGGQLWWQLKSGKSVTCNTTGSSGLRIYPPSHPKQVVHWNHGVSTCNAGGSGYAQFGVGGARGPTIRVTDPLFAVETDPDQGTTLKLALGFAEVTGASGLRGAVVVGPGQQTFVPPGGDPAQPSAMALTDAENAAAKVLRRRLPKPSFARPQVGSSPVLRDIFARTQIRVGIDPDGLTDEASSFLTSYFSFLATNWRVGLDLRNVARDEGLTEVAARQLDVFVTATDVPTQPGLTSSVLVSSPDGSTVWELVLPEDATYGEAMQSLLRNALFYGFYGNLYRGAFGGAEAPYDPLQAVLP